MIQLKKIRNITNHIKINKKTYASSNSFKNEEDLDRMLRSPNNLNNSVKQSQVIKESQDDQQKNIETSSINSENEEDLVINLERMLRSLNKMNNSHNEKQNNKAIDVE